MDWKKVTRISVSAVLSLLILCSIVGMVLLGVGVSNANKTGTFNLFGYSFHLNKSTAMEPDIMRNDLVVVRHADFSEIEAGDYAAFYYEEDGTEHLLVRKVEAVDGKSVVLVCGDDDRNQVTCAIFGRVVECSTELRHVDSGRSQSRSRSCTSGRELQFADLCNFFTHKTHLL